MPKTFYQNTKNEKHTIKSKTNKNKKTKNQIQKKQKNIEYLIVSGAKTLPIILGQRK